MALQGKTRAIPVLLRSVFECREKKRISAPGKAVVIFRVPSIVQILVINGGVLGKKLPRQLDAQNYRNYRNVLTDCLKVTKNSHTTQNETVIATEHLADAI
jgi:hypothetical protein